jgi:nickel/cobalt transporter (NicO) family protein
VIRSLAIGMLAGSAMIPQHPLGNFTVNRYDGLVAAPHELRIDHVQDLAEIPAAQVLEGGRAGPDLHAWAVRSCATASRVFQITESGRPVHPTVTAAAARTRPGQAGLPTLRLECRMTVPLADRPGGVAVTFRDPGAADHVGWHEVTAAGDRMTLTRASVPATSRSARLTAYPKDMLSSPLDQRSASFTVTPGGPALAAPAAPGGSAGGASGVLPRGVDRLTQSFTDLVARRHLTAGFALVALLIAVALGAVHALAPGHGKTIMAAQAVSRGRRGLRDILTLGLTVTVTHTLGVLVLGLLIAGGSTAVTPGLFPWLGAASGALVVLAGCSLLRRALRPSSGHEHGHGHGHTHEHGHGHEHGPGPADLPRRGTVVLMGFAGGLMPSPSAVVVLLGAVALGHAWFGVLLVLAYGLGLAATLTGIGVFITGSGRWLAARVPGLRDRAHRIPARLVPAGSAALVVLLGVALATRSLATALS